MTAPVYICNGANAACRGQQEHGRPCLHARLHREYNGCGDGYPSICRSHGRRIARCLPHRAAPMRECNRRALDILIERGPVSLAWLGDGLWGNRSRKPQTWCRPAGAVAARLVKAGLAYWVRDGRGRRWMAARGG